MATCSLLVEDQNLLDGISRRLPNDLEELYRRYAALLKSVIMRVLHDESEADEILQDVFCQVWEHVDHYSATKGKLSSWLCTLARRRAIDRLRQRSTYRRATKRYEISCRHLGNCSKDYIPSSAESSITNSASSYASTWPPYPRSSAT
jgi:RNA polymerase sigma factor (sigma-70 family)